MGSTVADYDNDGRPDIFKTNFSDDSSSLYHNNGDGTFTSTIFEAGLGLNTHYLGWGTMFIDVDNDGRPDMLSVNGHVYPEVDTAHLGSTYKRTAAFVLERWKRKIQRHQSRSAAQVAQSRNPAVASPSRTSGMMVGCPPS